MQRLGSPEQFGQPQQGLLLLHLRKQGDQCDEDDVLLSVLTMGQDQDKCVAMGGK